MAAAEGTIVLIGPTKPADARCYGAVRRVLVLVFILNAGVALAKIAFGYASNTLSILSDGFHSLTDAGSNLLALVGIMVSSKPPDAEHPYGHRKYETITAAGILIFLLLVVIQLIVRAMSGFERGEGPAVTLASFAVMGGTLLVNLAVVRYESRAAERLSSEVLFADAAQTRSDVLTSMAVITALVGIGAGYPFLDPLAALVVALFIAKACYQIGRDTSRIFSDRIVIAEDDLRAIVLGVPEVKGCHQIRTRGTADHVFLDLHVWFDPALRLDRAHDLSHEVKNRLMARFPQIRDAIIHIEPPPLPSPPTGGEG